MDDSIYAIIKNNPQMAMDYVKYQEERVKNIKIELSEEEMQRGLADIKERLILKRLFGK